MKYRLTLSTLCFTLFCVTANGQEVPKLIFMGSNENGSVAAVANSLENTGKNTKRIITINVPSNPITEKDLPQPMTHIATIVEANCSNNSVRMIHSQAFNIETGDMVFEWEDDREWSDAGRGTSSQDVFDFACLGRVKYGPIPSIREFVETVHRIQGR